MDLQNVIDHMNSDHQSALLGLAKKYSGSPTIENVKMVGVDFKGIDLVYNGEYTLRIDFMKECDKDGLKAAIIELCQGLEKTGDMEAIKKEIQEFEQSVASIFIASVNPQGQVVSSYAPIIQWNHKKYIYISEVADHFASIKAHPDNIEVLFIEDEFKSKTILARKRVKYRVHATFIDRDTEEFNQALDQLEADMKGGGGVKMIRMMQDFHLIALKPLSGRYVKGFGQAYDISMTGEITHVGGTGMPHKMPPHAKKTH